MNINVNFNMGEIKRNLEQANQIMKAAICEQTEVMEEICNNINDLIEALRSLDVRIHIPGELTCITEVYYNDELNKIFVETFPCE